MKAMDNFKVEVTSRGRFDLRRALNLVFEELHPSKDESGREPKVSGVKGSKVVDGAIELYWHFDDKLKEKGVVPFPYELKGDPLFEFLWGLLETVDPGGSKVGGDDGHSTKGWHLVGGDPGGWSYVCLTLRPVWAHHHK